MYLGMLVYVAYNLVFSIVRVYQGWVLIAIMAGGTLPASGGVAMPTHAVSGLPAL
jgi:hypothetical protein